MRQGAVGPSPIDVRRAPTEQPVRVIAKPEDLRAGDEVYVYRWDWKPGTIRRVYPPGTMRGEVVPRSALVQLENGRSVRRPVDELIPRTGDSSTPTDPHSRDAARVRAARWWESSRKNT